MVKGAPCETPSKSGRESNPGLFGPGPDLGRRSLFVNGRIELVQGRGEGITVEATIHAQGEDEAQTRELLESMSWITKKADSGRAIHTLSYPLEQYKTYQVPRPGESDQTFNTTRSNMPGLKAWEKANDDESQITITSEKTEDSIVLYADLKITYPASVWIDVENIAGGIQGDRLEGKLDADTNWGDIEIESFKGDLNVDNGLGQIIVGSVNGNLNADSSSGDVVVAALEGEGNIDTSSGDIELRRFKATTLQLDSSSGDILLSNGHADSINADVSSGLIELDEVEFRQFNADNSSGNVIITSSLLDAENVSVEVTSGSVTINCSDEASFVLRAELRSGRVNVGFDDASVRKHEDEVLVRRGDEETQIDVEVTSGEVEIRPAGSK
jgi:DUF4097 and DUF4098 domain-containing protein YvlB